ncbi:hypothetical protein B0H14DRAFT_2575396 [Mycena olivaceomarginata]|nr:hypothetical protein B0H14DRAFT_2575396 [Mycena olivaceomarginata]
MFATTEACGDRGRAWRPEGEGPTDKGQPAWGRLVLAGEMDKTAIISRAAQYIRHLKQNEVCNIEKHTLEKLLLEKAIDERKALLTNLRRMWGGRVQEPPGLLSRSWKLCAKAWQNL